ncbi:MAG: hypothetical protein RMJ33_14420 [Saprospiraceae bacterium]|nr:hypothetical protein [Saprospiraceae bacterium]MDW8231024.1 hypothetical protein [Saprospiraceae bacterium]
MTPRLLAYFTAFSAGASLLFYLTFTPGCKPAENKPLYEVIAEKFRSDPLPPDCAPAKVGFRDYNGYVSGDYYCLVSLVDNLSSDWVEIWVRAKLLDANGKPLKIKGDTSIIIRAFADAVPPVGSTAFFRAIPLSLISGGQPDTFLLEGAGVRFREPGPILVAPDNGGVRVQVPDPEDPKNKLKEVAFKSKTTLQNPLPIEALHPRLVYLIYAKDLKLYYAEMVNPEEKPKNLYMTSEGVLAGGTSREVFYDIAYEYLPQPIKDLSIVRVDVQAFEARPPQSNPGEPKR